MPVQRYLQKLTKYPPHVTTYKILKKIAVKLKVEAESLKADLFSTYISDKQLLESLVDPIGDIDELLRHIRERKQPNFFVQPFYRSKMVDIVKSHYPNAIKQTIADADKICEHVFNLLGSSDVHLGEKIDWHTDFKTGWRWKLKYYRKIDCTNLGRPCDVKVPWELSRCQHFVTLGKAYWYTSDEKYVKEFVAQINDWIDSNPPKFGVNWACTMDVAIRIVNWIWGYYFFKDLPLLTDEFLLNFLKSILAHGRHIMNNLENKGSITSNHYLSNIVGLIFLGVMFPEFKEARKWRKFGIQELINEMDKQVYPDGTDYEASISYHRLVTELFLSATILCLKNAEMLDIENSKSANPEHRALNLDNLLFPNWYIERLEKMIEFVMYYTKPDGNAPQIGDNDDGRLHILSNYGNWNRRDHRYLLSTGGYLFGRDDFIKAGGDETEEAFWLLSQFEENICIPPIQKKKINVSSCQLTSKVFKDAGIVIMRKDNIFMIVNAGKVGTNGLGNHKHNDIFSFELYVYDKAFIIDPGTYIYTAEPDMRNLFRSTRAHNTIQVDDTEINEFEENNLFEMKEHANPKIVRWEVADNYDFFEGEHSGYERLKEPIKHCRQIYFDKTSNLWVINDILTGKGKHKFDQYFHFAPMKITTHCEASLVIRSNIADGGNIMIVPVETEGLELSLEDSWVSYSYGTKVRACVARYSKVTNVPANFITVLYSFEGLDSICSPEKIRENVLTFIDNMGG